MSSWQQLQAIAPTLVGQNIEVNERLNSGRGVVTAMDVTDDHCTVTYRYFGDSDAQTRQVSRAVDSVELREEHLRLVVPTVGHSLIFF